MITCKLYGRTGNQLFQIAATVGHAKSHGFEYRIPARTLDPDIWDKHGFDLPELTGLEKFDGFYHEHSYRFQSIAPIDNIILDGYFQSYKYFEHIIPYLREILCVPDVTNWHIVSIHVRRGDYLNFPDKHPILPLEYYKEAIKYIIEQEKWKPEEFEIFVYSDDPDWCMKNFTKEVFGYDCFIQHTDEHPENDLYAMAMCQHNIIANSSFSYWGAILNPNPNKIVCAPTYQKWFGPGNKHLETNDLLLPSWAQINF